MDPTALLEQAIESTGRIIAGVQPGQLEDATPCTEWNLRALINHVIGGNWMFAALLSGQPVDFDAPPPDFTALDPAAAYADSAKAALAGWRAEGALDREVALPFGALPGAHALGLHVMDTTVHGWDIARASGQQAGIDPHLAGIVLENVRAGVSPEMRGPGRPFQAEVPVAADAPVVDQLVGFLGRTP